MEPLVSNPRDQETMGSGDENGFSHHCAFVWTGKNDLKTQHLEACFFEHGGKKKTSAFKQKRLNVLGAVEVSNTRDTSRILSIKKGIYCFVISLTLFGVAVLTRWWIYTGIYLIQKRLLWASGSCALGSFGGRTSKSMQWVLYAQLRMPNSQSHL